MFLPLKLWRVTAAKRQKPQRKPQVSDYVLTELYNDQSVPEWYVRTRVPELLEMRQVSAAQ